MTAAISLVAPCVGYPSAPPAIADVSLAIGPGERVAVLGGNGTGKSALLLTLVGLLRPEDGVLEVFGERVRSATEAVRAGVGLVLQNPDDQLFGPTLLEDVAFGPRNQGVGERAARARAAEAVAEWGLSEHENRTISTLSFGERKRAAVAAIVAMRPRVLLMDEPTAGLDPEGELALVRTLNALAEDRSTALLVATHAVDLVPLFAERVVILGRRRVLFDGPCEEAFRDLARLEAARLRRPWVTELFARTRTNTGARWPLTVEEAVSWTP